MLAVWLAVVALDADRTGDLRPEALARMDAHPALASFTEPATIRVWRRALDGSTSSCSGRVDVIPFEQYVKGVLPHEWIASWDDEALKAGAVAIRTYAAYWVNAGGKYSCADLDDTTASQVYRDDTLPNTDADTDATAGQVVLDGSGNLQFAEYSAENGDPTADGVDDPVCAGQTVNGHGHGVCQWGTQRWAQAGKTYDWMLTHYYPGASVVGIDPVWSASIANQQGVTTMTSGDEAVVWLEYTNTGNQTWDPTTAFVGTAEPHDRDSAFFKDGNWVSASRPTGADHSGQAPGAVARFTWAMVAPDVTTPTTYSESFQLVSADGTWFGDEVTWQITVNPAGGAAVGPDGGTGGGSDLGGNGGSGGDLGGGCNAGGGSAGCAILVLGALGLLRTGARRRLR